MACNYNKSKERERERKKERRRRRKHQVSEFNYIFVTPIQPLIYRSSHSYHIDHKIANRNKRYSP